MGSRKASKESYISRRRNNLREMRISHAWTSFLLSNTGLIFRSDWKQPHEAKYHSVLASCCRKDPAGKVNGECTHPPRCVNCGGNHLATSQECGFFIHRKNPDWIREHSVAKDTVQVGKSKDKGKSKDTSNAAQTIRSSSQPRPAIRRNIPDSSQAGPSNVTSVDHDVHMVPRDNSSPLV